jgi:MFS transporter, putative metabolite:H+ symporter
MRALSYEEALAGVGYGSFQRKLLLICGLGWAADAMEVLLVSFAMPSMSAEWGLSKAQTSLLATAIFIGMLVGALFWGRLADRIGRKLCFVLTIAVYSVFGGLSALAPSFEAFLILRFLTGIGVGGALPVDYGMFSEYLPPKNRGRRLVYLEAFWALGSILAALLAWAIVPRLGWRALFAASAVPAFLLLWARRGVPESPRFLYSRGRGAEARAVLERVAAANGTSLPEGELVPPSGAGKSRLAVLFEPKYLRTTLLLWLVWFAISIGYYGTFTWLPSWFRAKGFALPSVYLNSLIMALAQVPGYFSAAWLIEKLGRRRTLGAYLLASGLFAWLFALAATPASVVLTAVFLSFFALGAWGALYAYTPEAYPTSIRTTGIGAASAMTRIAGAIAPSIGAMVAAGASGASGAGGAVALALPLAVFAIAYALGGVGSFCLPSESKDVELEDS